MVKSYNSSADKYRRRPRRERPKVDVRASVGFDPKTYDALVDIADGKKVSLGSVVREAVQSYLKAREAPTVGKQ